MQQALTTSPVFRSVVLGGLVFGASVVAAVNQPDEHRLVLHAVDEPDAFYISAWHHGDVRLAFDADELRPLTFHTRARVYDGCRWLGIEQLTPIDHRTFVYAYSETILECDPGSVPLRKTPRMGLVTVED